MEDIKLWLTNNVTDISISIIIITFLYYWAQSLKICYKGYKSINKVCKEDSIIDAMLLTKFDKLAEIYKKSISINVGNELKTNVSADEIFDEHFVCLEIDVNLRQMDAASGTLVGLGLLGTFLGLTLGIDGFDSSNSEHIQNSIKVLLNGMGTAFSTSLVGMFLSLVFTIINKWHRNKLTKSILLLTKKLDSIYYIDDRTLDNLNEEILAKTISDNIKHVVENEIKMIVNTLNDKLSYKNEEGETIVLGNAIREILTENIEQSKALKSFSTDLAIELNNGFDEALSRQMQQKILPLMENVDITTKAIVEHIDKMAEQVSSPATEMIQNVVDELKNSMRSIMSSLSSSATSELENLALQLSTATQAMTDFPKTMESISSTLQITIEEVKSAVSDISNTSANANSAAMQQMHEQITFATTAISNAITEVKEVMGNITQSSEQQSSEMVNMLSNSAERFSTFLNDTITNLSLTLQDSIKNITEELNNKQTNLIAQQESANTTAIQQIQEQITFATSAIGTSISEVKDVMSNITQSAQLQSNEMVSKMNAATEQMGVFLNGTVSDLSVSVHESIKNITDDIIKRHTDLMVLQNETTKQTRQLLETFNIGLGRLEKTNENINGTMNIFQEVQGQITGSTAHLLAITGDMKLATQLFNKSQTDYSTKMDEMQRNSQKSIDELIRLLNNTGEMSQDYVEKFEVIKQGLGGIFAQLQLGLTEYSKTVQSTTQRYLDQYSTSLTNTTDALSSTIQQQNEVVEMLVESLNLHKR